MYIYASMYIYIYVCVLYVCMYMCIHYVYIYINVNPACLPISCIHHPSLPIIYICIWYTYIYTHTGNVALCIYILGMVNKLYMCVCIYVSVYIYNIYMWLCIYIYHKNFRGAPSNPRITNSSPKRCKSFDKLKACEQLSQCCVCLRQWHIEMAVKTLLAHQNRSYSWQMIGVFSHSMSVLCSSAAIASVPPAPPYSWAPLVDLEFDPHGNL